LVLRIRIAPGVWRSVSQSDPAFDQTLEGYMNEHASWIFKSLQAQGQASWFIECGDFRLWLATPKSPASGCDYNIIHLQEPKEHTPESKGEHIDTPIQIQPPTGGERSHQPRAPAPAPAKPKPATTASVDLEQALAKTNSGQIVFLLKIPTYRQLPEHEREPVNMAWRKAKHGRTARRVFWQDDAIFILTPDQTVPTNPNAAAHLNEALESVDAGRVITDPYEFKRALELADKFGENINQSGESGKREE